MRKLSELKRDSPLTDAALEVDVAGYTDTLSAPDLASVASGGW